MRLPVLQGLIRRRMLVNFRVDPAIMQQQLPEPFRPKLQAGCAVAGICLIRLEQSRAGFLSVPVGVSSANAAHRIAAEWIDAAGALQEGVFVSTRATNSRASASAGSRRTPGCYRTAP